MVVFVTKVNLAQLGTYSKMNNWLKEGILLYFKEFYTYQIFNK